MSPNRPLVAIPYCESTSYSTILQSSPTDGFLFNKVLLQYYGVSEHESETVANLVQNLYIHGNQAIQNGLTYMTNNMIHTVHDLSSLRQENTTLLERNSLLETAHAENAKKMEKFDELSSKLEFAKNSTIPTLQVISDAVYAVVAAFDPCILGGDRQVAREIRPTGGVLQRHGKELDPSGYTKVGC